MVRFGVRVRIRIVTFILSLLYRISGAIFVYYCLLIFRPVNLKKYKNVKEYM